MSSLQTPPKPARRGSSFSAAGSQPSRPQFRSKFSVSYEALLAGEHPWIATPSSSSSSSLINTPAISSVSTPSNGYFSSSSGKKPSAPRGRFFADLLCLKVEPKTVEALVKGVSPRQLTDDDEASQGARIRENVGSLWRECLRVWTDVPSGAEQDALSGGGFAASSVNISSEVRRVNAIDTLVELSRNILAKNLTHSSSSLDLIWIFAGGIDEADDVFEELVSAIDAGLRGELDNVTHHRRTARPSRMPSAPDADASLAQQRQRHAANEVASELPTLRDLLHHRLGAVRLAIIWISHVSATNLSTYFIRRDLFVGVCALLNGVQSILRTAHQAARSNLAEEDEELLRAIVRDTMLLVGLLGGLGQGSTAGTGIGVGSKTMDATSSPYFRRMCDWVDSGSMHLIRESLSVDLENAWHTYESQESGAASSSDASGGVSGIAASLGAVTEGLMKMTTSTTAAESGTALPPAQVSSLLSIYLMCRANQVFVEIIMQERAPRTNNTTGADTSAAAAETAEKATFAASLLSLTSYLVTHGSLNERARSYSRLALLVPLTLLTNSAGISALALTDRPSDAAAVRLCTQRSGPLPIRYPDPTESGMSLTGLFSGLASFGSGAQEGQARIRLLPYVLDVCVQYMRHNLRKRLDTSGFLICLQVLLLSIQTCADRRIELAYKEWPDVWGTITSTIAFLVGRHSELRGVEVGKLGQALLSLLSLALLESDRFLPTRHDTDVLIYQLVRSNDVMRRLAFIVALGRDPADQSTDSVSASGNADTVKVSQRAIVAALPMWRLLDLTLVGFDERLAEWSDKRSVRSAFALPFSVSALTGGYLSRSASQDGAANSDKAPSSGTSTPTGGTPMSPSLSRRMPDVQTVLTLISSLDMEHIVQRFYSESEGSGSGSGSDSAGLAAPSPFGSAVSPTIPRRSSSRMNSIVSRKGVFIDEEWLERAESQCLAEAFRFASDDMRKLVAAPVA